MPRHYIIRTSWVIGEGHNFVRTMASLAERGIDPTVVDDQTGRLTFTPDIAAGIRHLLDTRARIRHLQPHRRRPSPVAGPDAARAVFELTGHDPARITGVTTDEYFASATGPVAPRPRNSALDLTKLEAAGFTPADQRTSLAAYLDRPVPKT